MVFNQAISFISAHVRNWLVAGNSNYMDSYTYMFTKKNKKKNIKNVAVYQKLWHPYTKKKMQMIYVTNTIESNKF